MKTVLKHILAAALFACAFSACDTPPPDPPPDPPPAEPVLVLSADKYSLDADGVDKIVFTAKLDGVDVTAKSKVCMPGGDGVCLITPVFITTEPGEYKFYAKYDPDGDIENTIESENIVTITANDVSDPEEFDLDKAVKKNVVFFVWTGTYCAPCYTFKTYMKDIRESYVDDSHILEVCFYTDPIDCMPNRIGSPEYLVKTINQTAADGRFVLINQPEIILELREDMTGSSIPTETQVRLAINNYIINSPRTATKIDAVRSDDKVDVTVTVGAREADDYLIGIFLTEDHISAPQIGHGAGYDHTDVAREMGTEDIMGESLGAMTAGQTIEKRFSLPVAAHYNPENLHVVVYTMYKEDGYTVIDNTRKVPANGLSGYEYAE